MNMWISYSKYSTFKQCPLKYKFQYIDKIETKPAPALFFGSTIHTCLEFLHRPGDDTGHRTLADLLEYLNQHWTPPQEFTEADLEAACCTQERAQMLLTEYYMKHVGHDAEAGRTAEPARAHAVEKKFLIQFDGDIVNGIIDRVDLLENGESFEIIDYKTNKKAPKRLFEDNLEQLAIYKWAAEEGREWLDGSFDPGAALGFSPVKAAGLFFVDPSCNDKIFPDKELDVSGVKTRVREAIENIKAETAKSRKGEDAFAPCVNRLCDWCDFQEMCPIIR